MHNPINSPQSQHEAHEEAFSDNQIREVHEKFGIADRGYLQLPIEKQEFAEKGIDVNEDIQQDLTSYLAPFTVDRLLGQNIRLSEAQMNELKTKYMEAEKRGDKSEVAMIERLLKLKRYAHVNVKIGRNSNIQEIERLSPEMGQRISLKIGENSSLAHGVRFSFDDANLDDTCEIGDNVFVGISTKLGACKLEDHAGIGFNAILESGVKVGKRSIVCDGSIIQRGISLPPYCIVTPGLIVTDLIMKNKVLSPEEYGRINKEGKRTNENLIQFTDEQQEKIEEAEKKHKGGGAKMARQILQEAGVDASSLFLSTFNEIVVEENRMFPMLYRLVEKFHPDQVRHMRDDVMIVNLPVNRHEFLKYYFDAASNGEENPAPYKGEFTRCDIGNEVNIEGKTALIGNIEIRGKTKIGQHLCIRGDEMNPGEKVVINNAEIGENVTFHAVGEKLVDGAFIDDKCVIHGKSKIRCTDPRTKYLYGLGRHSTVHAVDITDSQLKAGSIVLGAKLRNCSIGKRNTIIGHAVPENGNVGQINLENVTTAERVTVSSGNNIAGMDFYRRLRIGRKSVIRENNTIRGYGKIRANSIIKPNCNLIVEGEMFMDVKEKEGGAKTRHQLLIESVKSLGSQLDKVQEELKSVREKSGGENAETREDELEERMEGLRKQYARVLDLL